MVRNEERRDNGRRKGTSRTLKGWGRVGADMGAAVESVCIFIVSRLLVPVLGMMGLGRKCPR